MIQICYRKKISKKNGYNKISFGFKISQVSTIHDYIRHKRLFLS